MGTIRLHLYVVVSFIKPKYSYILAVSYSGKLGDAATLRPEVIPD